MSAATCERCGAPLAPDALFCSRCGHPVGAFATEERKVVSVVFADLADSTKLAAGLDPERYREVMTAFYNTVSAELESLRGRAEKFAGDAVMAVFGIPQTHDDDALRAVRAGLLIRDRTARLGEELGLDVPFRVRVGINSGAVAAGSGPAGQFLVSGAPVNLAARLQEAAEPGEVLVGETTEQLTRDAVAFGEPRRIEPRGFGSPTLARPVIAISPRSSRRAIPLVDRRRELGILTEAFQRAHETRRAHLVTVLGEPGIGKSRLAEELVATLPDEAKVLSGRASQLEEDVTFAPLAEMIRRELGVERDTPPVEVRSRLRDLVVGCCEPSEAQQVVGRLGLALGLGRESADVDPEEFWAENLEQLKEYVETEGGERRRYRTAEVRSGLLRFLEGLSRQVPVVMVFEDLHQAQPELLDIVEQVLRRGRRLPLLVVCVARDALLELRPTWGGGAADAVTIRLEPLTDDEAADLARAAAENLDEPTLKQIVGHAGGNPFFIIEMTGMLLQQHPEHLLGADHGHIVPPTVQAVVAARMDHLSEPARDLARKASVFPRSTVHEDELSRIAEARRDSLAELEDAEILVPDEDRPGVWRFVNDILRDVAYDTLPKRERMRLHLAVAEGIQSQDAERYPQAIAWHLEQAARASLDLDPGNRDIADRAMKALAKAGDVTRRRMELRTAIDLYERGLALAGPRSEWGGRQALILSFLGEANYWLGEFQKAESYHRKALQVDGDDPWVRAHAHRFLGDISLNVHGDVDRAKRHFDTALSATEEIDDPWTRARTLLMAGWVPYWEGDIGGARLRFEQALETVRANPEGDPWAEARALVSLASVVTATGDERDALEMGRAAHAIGEKMEDAFTMAVAEQTIGNSLRRMMRLDEALPHIEEAVRTYRELGARWELASSLGERGDIHRLAGRLDLAEADLREALDLCRGLGERSLIAWTGGQLIKVLLSRGQTNEARMLLEDPSVWQEGDSGSRVASLLAEAYVALASGERQRALDRAIEALELERRDSWPNSVAARTWWMGRVFGEHAIEGPEALDEARRRLEAAHWQQFLVEPDLVVIGEAAESA